MKSGPHGGYPDPPKYGIAYLSIGFTFWLRNPILVLKILEHLESAKDFTDPVIV
jgi:hypothetical protein